MNTTQILNANNKIVRNNGTVFRITSVTLGEKVLAEATQVPSGERIDLMKSRSKVAMAIRNCIKLNLVS